MRDNVAQRNVRWFILAVGAIVATGKFGCPTYAATSDPASENTTGQPATWPVVRPRESVDWPNVSNDKGGMRFSELRQINRDNVKNLKVAWVYHTKDAKAEANTTIECTPIEVEGILYLTTVKTKVVALDAATGHELWNFDPHVGTSPNGFARPVTSGGVNRGVAYWSDGMFKGQRRVVVGLADGRLISLDARTGKPDPVFGKDGEVDMSAGLERDLSHLGYGPTSAPAIFENLIIVGFSVNESQPSAPGDIRAFDIHTGQQVWRFHTVPWPNEFGHEVWQGDSWKERGGANAWAGFTVDAQRGIVFAGTGSATNDFYGADRKGDDLFANCVLALDARTGKRLWHFQTVHHDLWDHDNPCPPVVVSVRHDGQLVDAVAQVTKTGYCYLLDRLTGKPLFGVQEQIAPASDVPGEVASLTQIVPLKPPPFSRQGFTEDDITNLSPEAHAFIASQLKSHHYGSPFTPPSVQGSIIAPGFHGGATWSGASFDPTTGWLYVNSNNTPYLSVLHSVGKDNPDYAFDGYTYFNDDQGYPAVKPPWGNLTAINLNTGEFAWQIVLGEFPELKAKGIPQTGTENFGGTIVTQSGLVFIGGTKDEMFHAFDKGTGKLLWQYKLDAGGYATPCTYSVNGRQFVVIAAGGGGKLRTKTGDSYVAFALPQ